MPIKKGAAAVGVKEATWSDRGAASGDRARALVRGAQCGLTTSTFGRDVIALIVDMVYARQQRAQAVGACV